MNTLRQLFASALATVTILTLPALAQSRFYLTVERSYSTTERPRVRLDFSKRREPLVLRILKPKDLHRFLEGQLKLARAYEEPSAALNPGHYVAKGVNQLPNPLAQFRNLLDTGFSKQLSEAGLSSPIHESTGTGVLPEPQEIIHTAPQGFDVVRELIIDLQQGGASTGDEFWWFNDSGYEDGRYEIRSLDLDPLQDGVYLVQGLQGKQEAQALLQVTSLAMQVKQSPSKILVRVINRQGVPVAGATVRVRDGRGTWQQLPNLSNSAGEILFENPEGILDGQLVLEATTASGAVALAETDFLPASAEEKAVYLVTDRPIFKPGETFSFKGSIRTTKNGELIVPPVTGKQATVRLSRADGSDAGVEIKAPVNEFGSFWGEIDLKASQAPGLYRVSADLEGRKYGGDLRVRDYVKPTFYLELTEKSPTVRPGETFSFKVRAQRFSGGAPYGTKYEYFLYRKRFEVPEFVVEAGGGLNAGHDYFGEVRSAASLTQPQRLFSSVEKRTAEASGDDSLEVRTNPWASAPAFDEDGTATVEFTVPATVANDPLAHGDEELTYTLVVRAQDSAGSQATVSENFYVTRSPVLPAAKFTTTVAAPGTAALEVAVRTTYPNGEAAPDTTGVVELTVESAKGKETLQPLPFTTGPAGIAHVSFTAPNLAGRLFAVAEVREFSGSRLSETARSNPESMLITGKEGEEIVPTSDLQLLAEQTILSPGEKTRLVALLPKGWGTGDAGTIWQTVAGDTIHESKAIEAKGLSHFFEVEARKEFGTGVYHTVTVPLAGGKFSEQVVGFRIVPSDKRLRVEVAPSLEYAPPLSPVEVAFHVTDHTGSPAARTELTVTVVDRAVYSVQPEMRPSLTDFFYPLTRLNLGTFYSDELQGYGYAEEIRRPNFQLAALKNQNKPAKRTVRDTAAFFPSVITDADGRASVTVDLPANLTEWIITALAFDAKGRLGEGRGKFVARSDISVDAVMPQFLREGDLVEASLRVSKDRESKTPLKIATQIEGPVEVAGKETVTEVTLPGKQERTIPFTISRLADSSGDAILSVSVTGDPALSIGGPREFDLSAALSAFENLTTASGERSTVTFDLPKGTAAKDLEVRVLDGLFGAALTASSSLVSYPFGCTEQLLHTTVPNLVLLELLSKAGIPDDKLGPLASMNTVNRAREYAALGLQKLAKNQKGNGGFALWPSDTEVSLPLTILALRSLSLAKAANVPGAETMYSRAENYVSDKLYQGDTDTLSSQELAIMAEVGLGYASEKPLREFVERALTTKELELNEVLDALVVLKARSDAWWFNDAVAKTGVAEPKEALLQRANALYDKFETELFVKTVSAEPSPLGFMYGAAPVLAKYLGALAVHDALPPARRDEVEHKLLVLLRGSSWTSTYDTALVITASMPVLEREAAELASGKGPKSLEVQADGTPLLTLDRIPGGFLGRLSALPGGRLPATLEVLGDAAAGNRARVVSASVKTVTPFNLVNENANGLTVRRDLFRITPQGVEPVSYDRPLSVGDVVMSRLRVSREPVAPAIGLPSEFVVIEDYIPALAEGVENEATYFADAKIAKSQDSYWAQVKDTQRYPDRTVRVMRIKPGAAAELYQVWRVAFAGTASLPPATAYDMYLAEVRGNTAADRLEAQK